MNDRQLLACVLVLLALLTVLILAGCATDLPVSH